METLYIIICMLVVIVKIFQAVKETKKPVQPQQPIPAPEFEPVFEGTEPQVPIEEAVIPIPRPKRRKKKEAPKPEILHIETPAPEKHILYVPKTDGSIRLNNQKEAKRAFIYSEIFNRKYS